MAHDPSVKRRYYAAREAGQEAAGAVWQSLSHRAAEPTNPFLDALVMYFVLH